MKYYLTPNHVKKGKYYAKVLTTQTMNEAQFIQYMLSKGTGQSLSDITAILTLRKECLEELTSAGYCVKEELDQRQAGIHGTFDSEDDFFDSKRHQLKVNIRPNAAHHKALQTKKVEKVQDIPDVSSPVISAVMDIGSNTKNKFLTSGGVVHVAGRRLKCDLTSPDEGVFLVRNDELTYRIAQMIRNKPSELIFNLPPDLAPGQYNLEVRNRISRSSDPLSGRMKERLEVLQD